MKRITAAVLFIVLLLCTSTGGAAMAQTTQPYTVITATGYPKSDWNDLVKKETVLIRCAEDLAAFSQAMQDVAELDARFGTGDFRIGFPTAAKQYKEAFFTSHDLAIYTSITGSSASYKLTGIEKTDKALTVTIDTVSPFMTMDISYKLVIIEIPKCDTAGRTVTVKYCSGW